MVADQLSGGGGAEGASSDKRGSVVCLMGEGLLAADSVEKIGFPKTLEY